MAKNDDLEITHEFLKQYLLYVENTESPKIMQVWSAIAAGSACMGRHVCLPFGIGDIYANMFILLVGPPATRKSQAIKYSAKLVEKYTAVRFAPDDTGGQRQGLIAAMEGDTVDKDELSELDLLDTAATVADIGNIDNVNISVNAVDAHQLYICASEFGTFMGEGNSSMTRLLNKIFDGESYEYKLKNTQQTLSDPLATLVGGTTASDIAKILPPEAIGQGFMSRFILVHAPKKDKKVARPSLHHGMEELVAETFAHMSYEMKGEMQETKEAAAYLDNLYENEVIKIDDTRFIYYTERRHIHLMKLSMVLAGMRRSMTIELQDVSQADTLLRYTEERMPDALGEFGLSPVGAAKQKMLEFLQHATGPVTNAILWQVMSRDMTRVDYSNSLRDLVNKDKIAEITAYGAIAFVAIGGVGDNLAFLAEEDMRGEKDEQQESNLGNELSDGLVDCLSTD